MSHNIEIALKRIKGVSVKIKIDDELTPIKKSDLINILNEALFCVEKDYESDPHS